MANIFTLSSQLGDEDRFTSSLQYLIELYPEIGQKIADHILKLSGKPHSKFIQSSDHPTATLQDKPDFLIDCEDVEIICEHKIDAPLGEKQLERYLALKRDKKNYLILITSQHCIVSEEVLNNSKYLRPIQSNYPYYRWQDIYPIIKEHNSRISQDFAEYMVSLGMKPWQSNILDNIFESAESANFFGQSWEKVRNEFKGKGALCKVSSQKLGFEIGRPFPWLRLLYIFATQQNKSYNFNYNGPYLMANIWVDKKDKNILRKTNEIIHIESKLGDIYGEFIELEAPWNKDVVCILQFHTPLFPILSKDVKIMQSRLLLFSKTIFEYIDEYKRNS